MRKLLTLAAASLMLVSAVSPALAGGCPPPRRSHASYYGSKHHGGYNHYSKRDSSRVSFSVGFGTGYSRGSSYWAGSSYYRRPYCPPPVYQRRTVVYTPVYQPVVREVYREPERVIVYRDAPQPQRLTWSDDLARAWDLLAQDRSRDARSLFAELADARPSRAEAKVGLAIAALDRGDEAEAIFAMRRAFEIDPAGARAPSVALDAIDRLLDRQIRDANRTDCAGEQHFLISALAHLAGDRRTADAALDKARSAGERGEAIDNLSDLLRDEARRSEYSRR